MQYNHTFDPETHVEKEKTLKQYKKYIDQAKEKDLHKKYGFEKIKEAAIKLAARKNKEIIQNRDSLQYYDAKGIESNVRDIAKKLGYNPKPYQPIDYINLFKTHPDITENHVTQAKKILNNVKHNQKLVGKSPSGIAAAIMYVSGILSENHLSIAKIARIGHTSQPTLRNITQTLVDITDKKDKLIEKHPCPKKTGWGK